MKEYRDKFKKNVIKLYDLFLEQEKTKSEMFTIREFVFAVMDRDFPEFNKRSIRIRNLAYGCKNQEKIKDIEARITAPVYNKERWFKDDFYEEMDEIYHSYLTPLKL